MCRQGKVTHFIFQCAKTFKNVQSNCKPNYRNVQRILSKFEKPSYLQPSKLTVHLGGYTSNRSFRSSVPVFSLSEREIKKQMDEISEKFGEAMELLSDARSSMGTTYFSDDMTDAEALIDEVLQDYNTFLGKLSDSQSKGVTRAIGLKMEELKAQLQLLKESIKD